MGMGGCLRSRWFSDPVYHLPHILNDTMPQIRQRIVFCDCFDCVQQPVTTDIASSYSVANEASARQDPPPKCLMFVLTGVLLQGVNLGSGAGRLLDDCHIPHLDRAAAQGSLCLLTQRMSSPADCCAELAQLLNTYDEWQQRVAATSLADRFKGLQAAFASNSSEARQLAASVGMSCSAVLEPDIDTKAAAEAGCPADSLGLCGVTSAPDRYRHRAGAAGGDEQLPVLLQQLPDPPEAARRLLQELELQQAETGIDMLLLHLDVDTSLLQHQQQQGQGPNAAARSAAARTLLCWLDRTLRFLNNSSAFKDTVLLTVIATPGASELPQSPSMLQQGGGAELLANRVVKETPGAAAAAAAHSLVHGQCKGVKPVLRPLQSWQQLGGLSIDVCPRRPMLCLRRLPGVVRRDGCTRFSLADCCSASAALALLVDRLLPEVAFKLGRAPKYGS